MSALSDSLRAAQAQTLAAAQRAYLAGRGMYPGEPMTQAESDGLTALMDAIGLTDKIEQAQLLSALEALRGFGVQGQAQTPPNGSKGESEPRAATEKQWKFIRDLADRSQKVAPEGPLTEEQASKVIDQLKAGTYDADAWAIPF